LQIGHSAPAGRSFNPIDALVDKEPEKQPLPMSDTSTDVIQQDGFDPVTSVFPSFKFWFPEATDCVAAARSVRKPTAATPKP